MHAALEHFFANRHDELVSTMRKVTGRSTDTIGLVREGGVKAFLEETVRPSARVEAGEIVDSSGKGTGQLDAVLLHPGIPSVALGEGRFLMFAEAAVAVLEVKSDLNKQWKEVQATWAKVVPLRRSPPIVHLGGTADETSVALPFVVIGLEGWAKGPTIEKHAKELQAMFGAGCPPIFVMNLDPPVYAVADKSGVSFDRAAERSAWADARPHLGFPR